MKDENKQSGGGDVIEDVQLLLRAASHRLYGTVLVRQPHKKIERAKTKECPEEAKESDSDEYFSSQHRPVAEDGPAPDFDVSEFLHGFSRLDTETETAERQSGI